MSGEARFCTSLVLRLSCVGGEKRAWYTLFAGLTIVTINDNDSKSHLSILMLLKFHYTSTTQFMPGFYSIYLISRKLVPAVKTMTFDL